MADKQQLDRSGFIAEKAFKEAVKKALKKHQQMGVPAVFMRNGKLVYLLPNGKIVDKAPEKRKRNK